VRWDCVVKHRDGELHPHSRQARDRDLALRSNGERRAGRKLMSRGGQAALRRHDPEIAKGAIAQ
jgi:hypothetical protein